MRLFIFKIGRIGPENVINIFFNFYLAFDSHRQKLNITLSAIIFSSKIGTFENYMGEI